MLRRGNRPTLEQLQVLDAIDRYGSFAAAARELCVVTSSVTHTVQNLEEQFRIVLFDRSGRTARFTSEGRALLAKARELLAHADVFDDEVQLIATGWESSLTIAIDQAMRIEPLMPLVAGFVQVAPATSLQLKREAVAGSWDALLSGRADLVVGAPADGPPGGGYESVPMCRREFVFVVAPGHALARHRDGVSAEEIARHRAVLVGDTAQAIPHWPMSMLACKTTLVVPDGATRLDMLLRGVACGFISSVAAKRHLKAGRLVALDVELEAPPRTSLLAWRAGDKGRARQWWTEQLLKPELAEQLIF